MFKMMSRFPREKIDIIKYNGQTLNQIDALISGSSALIEDTSIIIEDNDYIVRKLPNGLIEYYVVIDNGYCGGSGHGIPPHYQLKIEKTKNIPNIIMEANNKSDSIKDKFIKLVKEITQIESKFRTYNYEEIIYDNPDFIRWLEEVKYILHHFHRTTQSTYIEDIISEQGLVCHFDGMHYDERESFEKLKSSLIVIMNDIDSYYIDTIVTKGDASMKKPMLFISHASADIKYVQPLVELLADIGLNNETMFCSSVPDYHIPMDNDIYDYLKSLFDNYDLHVVFMLSDNYYKSAACLNEMGASWVLRKRYSTVLLPKFDFSAIKGAVNPTQISLKLDNDNIDELKVRLGELKDIISNEFGISVPSNRWEKKRDTFISTINSLMTEGD